MLAGVLSMLGGGWVVRGRREGGLTPSASIETGSFIGDLVLLFQASSGVFDQMFKVEEEKGMEGTEEGEGEREGEEK